MKVLESGQPRECSGSLTKDLPEPVPGYGSSLAPVLFSLLTVVTHLTESFKKVLSGFLILEVLITKEAKAWCGTAPMAVGIIRWRVKG